MSNKQTDILGIKINALKKPEVLDRLKGFLSSPECKHVATVNAEFIMQAQKDGRFKKILNACELNLADGIGILWAAKFISISRGKAGFRKLINLFLTGASLIFWPRYCRGIVPERISGVDLMLDLCQAAARNGEKVYLLGDDSGSAEMAAEKLFSYMPGLNISGMPGPWVDKQGNYDKEENQLVLAMINEFQPQYLFVAFNHPKAQYWIDDNKGRLSSVRLSIGVGGAFDFISGKAKRAPKIFRNLGIEWLWRLMVQPWRWSRILTATVRFIYRVYRFAN